MIDFTFGFFVGFLTCCSLIYIFWLVIKWFNNLGEKADDEQKEIFEKAKNEIKV